MDILMFCEVDYTYAVRGAQMGLAQAQSPLQLACIGAQWIPAWYPTWANLDLASARPTKRIRKELKSSY